MASIRYAIGHQGPSGGRDLATLWWLGIEKYSLSDFVKIELSINRFMLKVEK